MDLSIKNIREDIGNKFFLPSIQRAFVWKPEQIEKLFDSLLQGYPIGTILLWQLKDSKKISQMRFYSLNPHYTEGKEPEEADNPLNNKNEIFAVLDGQQRLTAIYIATHGYYEIKSRSKSHNFIEKELYINLLYSPEENSTTKYQFKFLDVQTASQQDKNIFWYKIKDISNLEDSYDRVAIVQKIQATTPGLTKQDLKRVDKTLDHLCTLLNSYDKKIIHAEVIESDKSLIDVLEIFVRVNSQGTKLTKTDLLLSSMSPYWEKVRNIFADLIRDIQTDYNITLDQDLIMKTAFACINKSVVFDLENFRKEIINQIKAQWENIRIALVDAADQLKELGFYDANLPAKNIIIPIAYYCFNNSKLKTTQIKKEIKLFVTLSLLKKVFTGSGDNTVDSMVTIINKEQSFIAIMKDKKFQESYRVSEEALEEWVELPKSRYSYLILSLIYGILDPKIILDQDHIHPKSKFKEKFFRECGIDSNEWDTWKEKRDCLPNLQLLKGGANKQKNSKFLLEWLEEQKISQEEFKKENFISSDVDLEFKNFKNFYEDRKKQLLKILTKELQILQ